MDQLNLDGFSLGELNTLDTQLAAVILQRMTGNLSEGVEAYVIKGRDVTLTPLKDLIELRGNVKNAIAKKAVEPDGLGIGLAQINEASGTTPAGGPYRWPFIQ